MTDAILTLNTGSSSIKFSLFETGHGGSLAAAAAVRGEIESIETDPHLVAADRAGRVLAERRWKAGTAFDALLEDVVEWVEARLGGKPPAGVGHRVVHGGASHAAPALVTPELLRDLDDLSRLAPLHQPRNVAPMRVIARLRAGLPQVACFETAFHRTMPPVGRARLPASWARPASAATASTACPTSTSPRGCARRRWREAGWSPPISATAPACARCGRVPAWTRPWASARSTGC